MKLFIASDHAGVDLKAKLVSQNPEIEWIDLGPTEKDSVDYSDFADQVAQKVMTTPHSKGVLICGSGQGMSMRANKYPLIRAALCWTPEIAKLSREHNDANVLCLGARFTSSETALEILKTFLETPFAGGRHEKRVAKIANPIN